MNGLKNTLNGFVLGNIDLKLVPKKKLETELETSPICAEAPHLWVCKKSDSVQPVKKPGNGTAGGGGLKSMCVLDPFSPGCDTINL